MAIERLLLLLDSEDRIIKRIVAEQLFSLPIKNLQSHAINLLSRESFLKKDIFTTCQLLETLKTMEGEDALKLLEHLSRLRFSFWDWKSLRIGFKARKILKKHKKNFFSNKNSGEKI